MKTSYAIAQLLALLSLLTGLVNTTAVNVHSSSTNAETTSAVDRDLAKVKESYSKIPLSFVANHGQADKQVKFTSRGGGYSLTLSPKTFTLAVVDTRNRSDSESASLVQATLLHSTVQHS